MLLIRRCRRGSTTSGESASPIPLRQTYIWVHRSEHRIAIPHSKSTQYSLSIFCLYHFARSCCSDSNHFAPQIFIDFPFICPLKSSEEFLLKFAHSCSRLAANQAVIDVGRDIDEISSPYFPPFGRTHTDSSNPTCSKPSLIK